MKRGPVSSAQITCDWSLAGGLAEAHGRPRVFVWILTYVLHLADGLETSTERALGVCGLHHVHVPYWYT